MKRAYILSLVLLCLFGTMIVRLTFADFPNITIIASIIIFSGGIILLICKLRKKITSKQEESGNDFLPPILKHSRALRVLFAIVALALIVSVLALPVFLLFLSIDQIFIYIENYFFYQIAILGVFFIPFVLKKLK